MSCHIIIINFSSGETGRDRRGKKHTENGPPPTCRSQAATPLKCPPKMKSSSSKTLSKSVQSAGISSHVISCQNASRRRQRPDGAGWFVARLSSGFVNTWCSLVGRIKVCNRESKGFKGSCGEKQNKTARCKCIDGRLCCYTGDSDRRRALR